MPTFEFTIIASGVDPLAEDFEDRFFDAGCGDATLVLQKGAITLDFSRTGESFAEALSSALSDVAKTGARIERVEPDHLVSLADIARRSGLSRAAVTLYAKGERGTSFPAPIARVTSESALWDWAEVSGWLRDRSLVSVETCRQAAAIRSANHGISSRSLAPSAAHGEAA